MAFRYAFAGGRKSQILTRIPLYKVGVYLSIHLFFFVSQNYYRNNFLSHPFSASYRRNEWLIKAFTLSSWRHIVARTHTTATDVGKLASPCGTLRVPPHSTQLIEDGHQSPSHLVLSKFRQLGQDLSHTNPAAAAAAATAGLNQTNISVANQNAAAAAAAAAAVGAAQKDEWFV